MLTLAVRSSSICKNIVIISLLSFYNFKNLQIKSHYHDVLAVEVEPAPVLTLEAVQEGHSAGNVQGESECSGSVDHHSGAAVQESVKAAPGHVLRDNGKLRRLIDATQYWQHIGMREYPQLGELLVEVSRDSRAALAQRQHLNDNVVVLPSTSPSLAARRAGQVGVQRQVCHVDAFVSGQGGIA